MLSVVVLCVVMLNVIMLNVVAPRGGVEGNMQDPVLFLVLAKWAMS